MGPSEDQRIQKMKKKALRNNNENKVASKYYSPLLPTGSGGVLGLRTASGDVRGGGKHDEPGCGASEDLLDYQAFNEKDFHASNANLRLPSKLGQAGWVGGPLGHCQEPAE